MTIERVGKVMQQFNEKLNRFGEWIIRLVVLNILWVGFSVAGLGILGIFPATSALFSVLRKWMVDQKQVKMVSEFTHYYKKDFWKSNGLGYFFSVLAMVILIDYQFITTIANVGMLALGYVLIVMLAFSLLSLCVLFPIYSHYQLSFFQYVKNIILFPLTHLVSMIVMLASLFIIQFIFSEVPGFILFIGISFPAFVIMRIVLPCFQGKQLSLSGFSKLFKKSKEESMYY